MHPLQGGAWRTGTSSDGFSPLTTYGKHSGDVPATGVCFRKLPFFLKILMFLIFTIFHCLKVVHCSSVQAGKHVSGGSKRLGL